jgi:hypothetical protein
MGQTDLTWKDKYLTLIATGHNQSTLSVHDRPYINPNLRRQAQSNAYLTAADQEFGPEIDMVYKSYRRTVKLVPTRVKTAKPAQVASKVSFSS